MKTKTLTRLTLILGSSVAITTMWVLVSSSITQITTTATAQGSPCGVENYTPCLPTESTASIPWAMQVCGGETCLLDTSAGNQYMASYTVTSESNQAVDMGDAPQCSYLCPNCPCLGPDDVGGPTPGWFPNSTRHGPHCWFPNGDGWGWPQWPQPSCTKY